jgi:hypothetical protein
VGRARGGYEAAACGGGRAAVRRGGSGARATWQRWASGAAAEALAERRWRLRGESRVARRRRCGLQIGRANEMKHACVISHP